MTTGDPSNFPGTTTSTGNGSTLTSSSVFSTINGTTLTTTTTSGLPFTTYTYSPPVSIYATTEDIKEIDKRLSEIEDRLSILRIDETLHSKYPALREAYEAYKIIEGLVKDSNVHK